MQEENKLRGLVFLKFPSYAAFAQHIGWNKQKLSKIMLKKKEPTITEIAQIAEGLERNIEEVASFFLQK